MKTITITLTQLQYDTLIIALATATTVALEERDDGMLQMLRSLVNTVRGKPDLAD